MNEREEREGNGGSGDGPLTQIAGSVPGFSHIFIVYLSTAAAVLFKLNKQNCTRFH